ncbi:MAG TPA: DUF4198 domain-containing protein [Anaeromyxobacteraceae bacterium]|jgi:uncharacterized GH25 family protein
MQRVLRALAAAVLAAPAMAAAHDFWVERTGDGFAVRYGHRGGELLAIDAGKVKAVRCLDGAGALRDVGSTVRFAPREVRFAGDCAAASVFHDGGTWSLTPDGEVNLPRSRVEAAVRSWTSRQYAKWVDARSPRAGAVLGDGLEVVPVSDLLRARQGDKVALRVLSAGRPVPGAVVAVDHRPLGETDSKGEVRVRLRAAAVESVSASVRRPGASPGAEAEVLEASLSFEVSR